MPVLEAWSALTAGVGFQPEEIDIARTVSVTVRCAASGWRPA
jgi:hypothetical protein